MATTPAVIPAYWVQSISQPPLSPGPGAHRLGGDGQSWFPVVIYLQTQYSTLYEVRGQVVNTRGRLAFRKLDSNDVVSSGKL